MPLVHPPYELQYKGIYTSVWLSEDKYKELVFTDRLTLNEILDYVYVKKKYKAIKLHVKYFYQLIKDGKYMEIWFEFNYDNNTKTWDYYVNEDIALNIDNDKMKDKTLLLSIGLPHYWWWFDTGLYKIMRPFRIVGSIITLQWFILYSDYEYQYLVHEVIPKYDNL